MGNKGEKESCSNIAAPSNLPLIVNKILSCFKLNPFEFMKLPFDSPSEDVKKQCRKLSLLVLPDKCKHPQAKEAFKDHKNLLEEAASNMQEFQQELKLKFRELLTEKEWLRRKIAMRISDEDGHLKKGEEEQWKRKREHAEQWEGTREQRVCFHCLF